MQHGGAIGGVVELVDEAVEVADVLVSRLPCDSRYVQARRGSASRAAMISAARVAIAALVPSSTSTMPKKPTGLPRCTVS